MTCPVCGGPTKVVDSRKDYDNVIRRRKCKICGYKLYTEETESDTAREAFSSIFLKKRLNALKKE